MRALVIAASLALLASPVTAGNPPPIAPAQASHDVGACVTVEGNASIFRDSQRPGIDIDLHDDEFDQRLAYGGIPPFTAYVPYPDGFPGLQSLDGKNVAITGVVLLDRGVPSIQLNNPELIWARGSAPDKLITCDND